MIRRPLISTLFPYTTLFRSVLIVQAALALLWPGSGWARSGVVQTKDGQVLRGQIRLSDRKSTRLNSSHLGISYAVFCLKKKKRPRYEVSVAAIARSQRA